MEKVKQLLQEKKPKTLKKLSWHRVWVIILLIAVFIGILWVGLIAYARGYEGKVIPGVRIGDTPIGGMDAPELKRFLQDMNDKLINDGLHLVLADEQQPRDLVIYPVFVTETHSIELITIDIDAEVARYINYGKHGGLFSRAMNIMQSRIGGEHVPLEYVTTDRDRINETVADYIAEYEQPARDASVAISEVSPLAYHVVTSSIGTTYHYKNIDTEFANSWKDLRVPYVELNKVEEEPSVTNEDIKPLLSQLEPMFEGNPITLRFTDPQTSRESQWKFGLRDMADLIRVVQEENEFRWALDMASTSAYLNNTIAEDIAVKAQDARFKVENGRVVEFQGSRPGVTVDVEETYAALNTAFRSRFLHDQPIESVQVITKQTEPSLSTGEVNDLGISEILGQGESSYAGSPSNRIKNIKNALSKLNGILVKPGEEFSTIEHTQPYTVEGGYLPELVIKGDEIKPEIGGGLCQVGSTLFRMAMNSGMEITERRNHSLVVNYYNDLTNGLPGTDATIYDPAPDFRFRNDTDDYILIETTMDEVNQHLIFTIWGTSDGRKGRYSPPVVDRWIPYGETRIVETTKLAPGERECQHAYRGADTHFTYTRTLADGSTEDIVYESHYRPLPEICLVGVDTAAGEACKEGDDSCIMTEDTSTEETSSNENTPLEAPDPSEPIEEIE